MTQDFASFLKKRLVQHSLPEDHTGPGSSELRPGERRDIAVLFLDLGGFTALSERLDHEAVHEISKGVMDALVEITGNFGGYVDKIEGDRIMVLFGATKAGENDSERAVSCALLMLDAISTANDILSETGVPITARIGINSGPVTVAPDAIGHLTAIGSTVNIASRMEEAAQEGSVLLPVTVMDKCRDLFTWVDRGTVSLKGVSRPVHAFSPVERLSIRRNRWERFSGDGFTSFVGRRRELSELSGLLEEHLSGAAGKGRLGTLRHTVLEVTGEAGIGKSRLVHEFIDSSCGGVPGTMVISGQTQSYAQPAYQLWVSMLRDLLHMDASSRPGYPEFRDRVLSLSGGGEIADSIPFLAELLSIRSGDRRLEDLDSGAIALETRIAIRNLLKALASDRHPVIVLEDLQWMDSTCRGVLDFLVANCPSGNPLFIFLVGRPETDDGRPVRFDVNPGYARLERMTVPPMEGDECRGIIGALLGRFGGDGHLPVSSRAEEFLLRHSQGNPFFLEELVLEMLESGLLGIHEGSWTFSSSLEDISVPHSLTGLLQSRLDRLSEDHRGSLQKSSVLGFEFRLMLYRHLLEQLGLDEDTETVFGDLERRQFLLGKESAAGRMFEFRHILIHDTVYRTILERNRKLLHRLTACIIEEGLEKDDREMADILAHHWERAGDREKALHWGVLSLRKAVVTYQHERAMTLSVRLEDLIRRKPLECENLERLMEVLLSRYATLDMLGRRREQEELLLSMKELAETHAMQEWQLRIWTSLGSVLRITGRLQEAEDSYRRALALAEERSDRQSQGKVLCNLGILSRIKGDLEGSESLFQRALEMNRIEGDPRIEGVLLGNLGNLYYDQGLMDEAIEYYEKALAMNREVGDRRSEGIALGNLGNPYKARGDLDTALSYYRQSLELHREIGNRRSEGVTLSNLGALYYDHGRFQESGECNDLALEIHRETGSMMMEAVTLSCLALLRTLSGDTEGAMAHYRRIVDVVDELGLSEGGFDHFRELRRRLLEQGLTEDDVPLPKGWA